MPISACQKTDGPQADPCATAQRYARALLGSLGHGAPDRASAAEATREPHPALAWARSGAMSLVGEADAPALLCPAPLASCADGVVLALHSLAPGVLPDDLCGSALLGERAAIAGLGRRGAISPGGACRLLPSATGPVAVNLAREPDWELIPAWLEPTRWDADLPHARRWAALAKCIACRDAASLIERGRLLGLAVALAERPAPTASEWFTAEGRSLPGPSHPAPPPASPGRAAHRPLVVDLSALWAGPLSSQILALLGAEVIKVESPSRPDGARDGPRAFFDLMNGGKASVAIDLATPGGREDLLRLVSRADIVIEGSRPRALRQLGIVAQEMLARAPALTWVSLTGHGREEPGAGWIAFGDDAGVDAGLSALLHEVTGEWLICADAIADPLAGLHAALAAWASYRTGGGRLLSIALTRVAAFAAAFELPGSAAARRERHSQWRAVLERSGEPVAPPRARAVRQAARPLGADNERVPR